MGTIETWAFQAIKIWESHLKWGGEGREGRRGERERKREKERKEKKEKGKRSVSDGGE